MPIDFSKIRALTAGEIIRALLADGFVLRRAGMVATDVISILTAGGSRSLFTARTPLSFPRRSMIEEQARWNEEDLARLRLVK